MMIQNNALVVDIDITLMTRQATNTVESYNQVTNAVASGSFILHLSLIQNLRAFKHLREH